MSVYLIISIAVLALDQFTKLLTVKYLMPVGDLPLIDGVLHLSYCENTGAAFGIFHDNTLALTVTTVIVSVLLVFFFIKQYKKNPGKKLYLTGIAMIFGGAIGNLIDRIFRGYVVDFVYIKIIDFAVFNVADIALTFGCIFLAYCLLFDREIQL